MLFEVIPDEFDKWVPFALSYLCKLVATSIVWWLYQHISGLYTAIGGGLAFSCALLHYVHVNGYAKYDNGSIGAALDSAATRALSAPKEWRARAIREDGRGMGKARGAGHTRLT